MSQLRWPLFAACLVITASVSAVAPQRTFVASYGADTNPCSLAAPCRGFQAAINAVAAGGEVVAIDTAGYGAMEIHKSVSVIVPPGVHAGLSPSMGIPLPGYPGQYGVVLIDIQDTDVVVLRGLEINHQGTVTGGIEWISTHGGTVHIEDVVVNGFPMEGMYVQAPSGKAFVTNSHFRNNAVGIFGGLLGSGTSTRDKGIFADRVRIENSSMYGVRILNGVLAHFSNCNFFSNDTGIRVQSVSDNSVIFLDHCTVAGSKTNVFVLEGGAIPTSYASMHASASTILLDAYYEVSGMTFLSSDGGNNSTGILFDSTSPTR